MTVQMAIEVFLLLMIASLVSVQGLTCLQCDTVLRPRHCHSVVDCEADEVCYTTRSLVTQHYELGCRKSSVCPRTLPHNGTACSDCCNSDLCNAQGCGEPGYPAVRGPVCYDCYDHADQHQCTYIDICSVAEECSILRRDEFGDKILTSGCKNRHVCQLSIAQPSSIIGRRSVQDTRSSSLILCNECCSHDLCNLNCSKDLCHSSPCQKGSCSSDGFTYTCLCIAGWSGFDCDQQINHCVSSPCFNGMCVNEIQGFHCDCNNGSYGRLCDKIDYCRASPCVSGSCTNLDDGFHCDCPSFKYGRYCEHSTYDCLDIKQNSLNRNLTDGIYKILPNKTGPEIDVYCDMTTDGGGWVVFQKRFNGSVNFYRNFTEYENGFGALNGEFWLGLKYIYLMTDGIGSELRLDLEQANDGKAYEVFQSFYLSPNPQYTLHIARGTGTAGDSTYGLSFHNNYKFATFDHSADTCPQQCHSGWWFHRCVNVNLNGMYITPGTVGRNRSGENGIIYKAWTSYASLKRTEMKFRRS